MAPPKLQMATTISAIALVVVALLTPSVVVALSTPPSWASGGFAAESFNRNALLGAGKLFTVRLPLDHFGPGDDDKRVSVRFWVDTSTFRAMPYSGPVLFTMGGEGPAGGVSSTSWVAQLADKIGAAQVVIEHRFYGESMPSECGGDPSCELSNENLRFLTVDQALADAAAVIRMVDESLSEGHLWGPLELSSGNPAGGHGFAHEYRTKRPWIAAGGSYSGALSAWFRQSYPNLVLGALSSSGVVDALLDYPEFDEVIAAAVGPRCGSTLRRLVDYADALMAGTEDEKAFARTAMKAPAGLADNDYRYMMADSFSMAVQYGHKTALCSKMQELEDSPDSDILYGFSDFTVWLWGGSFAAGCFYDTSCLKGNTEKWTENGRGWRWQKCYEMAFLQRAPAATGSNTATLRSPYLTLDVLLQQCDDVFGLGTSDRLLETNAALQARRGAAHPNGTSNIFFTNFSDDPWQSAGVQPLEEDGSEALGRCYVECDDCGHCMDLHAPGASDPEPLKVCREKAERAVDRWLSGAQAMTARAWREGPAAAAA